MRLHSPVRSKPIRVQAQLTENERNSKYYVVGGPVQPDRDCYIVRDADAALYARLHDGEYCHVLAPRQTGKTSLAARTARRLRDEGMHVALVDLSQTGGGEQAEDAGRWYYSIAYRIIRELRIRTDMQEWWKDHSGLTNLQRMREFFLEVVVADPDHQVVVILDRLESTLGRALTQDLFGTIRSCYDARATEPEFQRLTFAMLGAASAQELVSTVHDTPFEISAAIPLRDFRKDEMGKLASGLGDSDAETGRVIDRVWTWAHGQPYLCQKIFRGLARKIDETLTTRTVDDVVEAAFLNPTAPLQEPHLSLISERLLADSPRKVARLNLFGRVRKGSIVPAEPSADIQQELLISGVVIEDDSGDLVVRNTLYAEVFSTKWVNQNLPFGWRGFGIAAVVLAVIVAVPVWYSEYLPRPYVRTLSAATEDYQVALDAYESLNMLPGFGRTADQLFSDFLTRQSRRAGTLNEAMRAHGRLMQIPVGSEKADGLLAEFWDRQAAAYSNAGDRDGALIAVLRALKTPTDKRLGLAAEMIGDDYRRLSGTIRTPGTIRFHEADATAGLLTLLDDRNTVQVWELAADGPRRVKSLELVAEERVQLQRRRMVTAEGTGQRLVLRVNTDHPRPVTVEVQLRAPSGRKVALRLDEAAGTGQAGEFGFDSGSRPDLRELLADNVTGTWTASFTDTEQGVRGQLLEWDLQIDGQSADEPADSAAEIAEIPEPQASGRLTSVLGPSGSLALVWPVDREARGEVLVWDLTGEGVLTRIPRGDDFAGAYFVLGGRAVVTVDSRYLQVWETISGERLGEIPLTIAQQPDPVLSGNGRYLVVDVLREQAGNTLVVWDLDALLAVGELVIGERSGPVAIDSKGSKLAIGDNDRLVRIWSVADGVLLRELDHGAAPRSLLFGPAGRWLASDDAINRLRLWNLEAAGDPVLERAGNARWRVAFSVDASQLLIGSGGRPYEALALPRATSLGVTLLHARPFAAADVTPLAPLILAARNLAVTHDGVSGLKVWQLPPVSSTQPSETAAALRGTRSAISPAGERIAVGTADGDVRILPVEDGSGLLISAGEGPRFIGHASPVSSLTFVADGSLVASGSIGGSVRVWDVASGAPRDFIAIHPDGAVHDLLFLDPAGNLASASRNRVIVTDTSSGEALAELRIQARRPRLASAAAAGLVLIAGDRDGITLWDWQAGRTNRFRSVESRITNAAVTTEGTLVVTTSADGTLKLWNLESGTPFERTVKAPGNIDDLWISNGSDTVIVHAGQWLQSLFMYPVGLAPQATRLLSGSPSAVQPAAVGESVFVLLHAYSSRPIVKEFQFDVVDEALLDAVPAELEQTWQARLALTLNAAGELEPL